ncbi:MAG: hemerythrin domain-containing protein [Nitrososphaerota archaeon]|nr:hemerythrin domain-containing protein [Nitrososphaerota archaeon]
MSRLAKPGEGTQTELVAPLSREELSVVTANLRFALENCPVDGGVLTEDGSASSEESVRSLLKKLEAAKTRPISLRDLPNGEVKLLKAIAEYAIKECPIDGAMMLNSGRFISKDDLRSLKQKLDALPQTTTTAGRALSAVEILEQEHRLILRVVNLLPTIRRNVDAGVVDESVLPSVVDFFTAFTDGYHHAKEEGLLFPALQLRGVSPRGCPVGTLKLEHQQGRSLMGTLKSAVEKYSEGDPGAASAISSVLKDAEDLYTTHIWREDYLLFPMSGKVLPSSDQEELTRDSAKVQSKFGSGFLERYELLVDKLERSANQTPGPAQPIGSRVPIVSS